jgi:hypothetical protein
MKDSDKSNFSKAMTRINSTDNISTSAFIIPDEPLSLQTSLSNSNQQKTQNFMRYFLTCLWFFTFSSFAQQTLPVWHDSTVIKREIVWQSGAQMHSNHLGSDIGRMILFGGFVNDEMKENSFRFLRANGMNRTGGVINSDLVYTDYTIDLFKKKQYGLVILAGYQNYFAASYPSDLFKLIANGNADFDGNIDLTNSRFFQMDHQKLGFGIVDKKTRSTFALSFVNSAGFQSADIINGVFMQNENKDTTDLLLIGSYKGNGLRGGANGLGAAIDVDMRIPVLVGKNKVLIQLTAQNVGFVRYNRASFQYDVDTNYRYTGFSLNQIQNFSQNDAFSLADTLNVRRQSGGQTVWLPGFLQVAKIVDRNSENSFQSFFGLNVFTQIIYLPQAFAGVHWQPNKTFAAGLHGSYGGFGGARIGCYADALFGQFRVGLSSQDLLGTVANKGYGHSLLFRLAWQQK